VLSRFFAFEHADEVTRRWNKASIHGIDGQAKLLQGDSAKQRLAASISKDYGRRLHSAIEPDPNPGDAIGYLLAIRQNEGPLFFWLDSKSRKEVSWQRTVCRSSVDQRRDLFEPAAVHPAEFELTSKRAH
jgi:hypothetical protein